MAGIKALRAGSVRMIADTTAVAWFVIAYLIAMTWLLSGWMQ